MSTAPNASGILLSSGIQALTQSVLSGQPAQLDSVTFGSAAGITVTDGVTSVSPTTEYAANGSIVTSNFENNQLSYELYLDETIGTFAIGNCMLYLSYEGTVIPFIWVVFPQAVNKVASTTTDPGNFIAIKITGNLISGSISITTTLSIGPPVIAGLPVVSNSNLLPTPSSSTFQQYVLDSVDVYNNPAIAARRNADNTWYATPILQKIDDHRFGWIYGGQFGDGYYEEWRQTIFGGFFLTTPSGFFTVIDGGANWAPADLTATIDGGTF